MRGRGVGQIIASRNPDFAEGEIFVGSLGWQDYSIQKPRGADFVFSTKKGHRSGQAVYPRPSEYLGKLVSALTWDS